MEMIGSANDFAAKRIYKAPAVKNAFVGSSNRNRGLVYCGFSRVFFLSSVLLSTLLISFV